MYNQKIVTNKNILVPNSKMFLWLLNHLLHEARVGKKFDLQYICIYLFAFLIIIYNIY